MTYQDAIDWLYTQLPVFQKTGGAAYHPGLDNITELLEELGNPQTQFKAIHVAGTNGKGSVSHMLSAIFQKAGKKVGLYTSPHLRNFEERVKINGKEISRDLVIEFTQRMQKSKVKPSFFEMTVALAFYHFANEKVDIAIVEVGMGGRLDSTNVINPLLSIITNISLDHQQYLGDSLEKIAYEKAGIIKESTPVIVGEYLKETKPVFKNKALSCNASIYFAEDELNLPVYTSDLKGAYQAKNLQTVSTALKVLAELGYEFSNEIITSAFSNVQGLTGLKGRYQTIGTSPKIITDTGHNLAAMHYLIPQIVSENSKNLHIVFGMVTDKDRTAILEIMPKNATYYFCKPDIPRGLDAKELQKEAASCRLKGASYPSVNEALNAAKQKATVNDLIFVGGSTFVVAEVV